MSSPFLGEIRVVGFNFAPAGWATCDGQQMSIQQNTALFSLLGVNFGGNGTTTFGLPNFQGTAPVFWGQGTGLTEYVIGETGGAQTVTITAETTPAHNHNPVYADEEGANDLTVAGDLYAIAGGNTYGPPTTAVFSPQALQAIGGSQPHDNMAPYVVLLYVIALRGVFPARN